MIIIIISHMFEPIADETLGVFNASSVRLMNDLGRRISSISGDTRETSHLYQRVSVLVQRFNAVLLYTTACRSLNARTEHHTLSVYFCQFLNLLLKSLQGASYTTKSLQGASYTTKSLQGASYTTKSLRGTSYTTKSLHGASYTTKFVQGASYRTKSVQAASYTTKSHQGPSYTTKSLQGASLSCVPSTVCWLWSGVGAVQLPRGDPVSGDESSLSVLLLRASGVVLVRHYLRHHVHLASSHHYVGR